MMASGSNDMSNASSNNPSLASSGSMSQATVAGDIHIVSSKDMWSSGAVLCVLSNTPQLEIEVPGKKGNESTKKTVPAGLFLSETILPLMKMQKHGFRIMFATENGRLPPLDPSSDSLLYFGLNYFSYRRAKNFLTELYKQVDLGSVKVLSFDELPSSDLSAVDALFVPGGHSPIPNLWKDQRLYALFEQFHAARKPTACICHGPLALLTASKTFGQAPEYAANAHPSAPPTTRFLYAGYKMTCISVTEEKSMETMWRGKLPFYVTDKLRNVGALVEQNPAFLPKVVHDRELITGQNPSSVTPFKNELCRAAMMYRDLRLNGQLRAFEQAATPARASSRFEAAPSGVTEPSAKFVAAGQQQLPYGMQQPEQQQQASY